MSELMNRITHHTNELLRDINVLTAERDTYAAQAATTRERVYTLQRGLLAETNAKLEAEKVIRELREELARMEARQEALVSERDGAREESKLLHKALNALVCSRWLSIDFDRNRTPEAVALRRAACEALDYSEVQP